MATGRQRPSGKWEFIVKRKAVLAKPLTFTFDSEAEGKRYCGNLEAQLDAGIKPVEIAGEINRKYTLAHAIREYQSVVAVPPSDQRILAALQIEYLQVPLATIDYQWVEAQITVRKRERKLAPGTIRHHIGALSRCIDWCVRQGKSGIAVNPARLLRKGYAKYTAKDEAVAGVRRIDQSRERRVMRNEEEAIKKILTKHSQGRDLSLMFTLAIETAMRMREMFSLTAEQIDLKRRTIFLDKTKNGDNRQVPLSTVAGAALKDANLKTGQLFPWWNGRADHLDKTTFTLSRAWASVFEEAGCPDLRFHDLRHEATSRLYERTEMGDIEISKISGHKDLRMLSRYANLRGSNLAVKLW